MVGAGLVDYSGTKTYDRISQTVGNEGKTFVLNPVYDEGLNNFLGYKASRITGERDPIADGDGELQSDGTYKQNAFFVSADKVDYFIENSDKFYDSSKLYSKYYALWGQMEESPVGAFLDPRFAVGANIEGVIGRRLLRNLSRKLAFNIIREEQKRVLDILKDRVASKELSRKKLQDITTVVTGIHIETGQTATALHLSRTSQNRGALCAEDYSSPHP